MKRYQRYLAQFLIATLSPEDVTGLNVVIPPRPPLTTEPMRSGRVTDPKCLRSVCSGLRLCSYTWSGIMSETPRGPDGLGGTLGSFQRSIRPPEPAWLSIEIWLRDEPQPLTIWVYHLRNSYEFHEDGLTAVWKDKTASLSNDYLTALLVKAWVLRYPYEDVLYGLDDGEWVTWPARYQATYFGGIRVGPDGQPWHKVTREEKIRQTRALIEAHKFSLLGIPATQATDAAEAAK